MIIAACHNMFLGDYVAWLVNAGGFVIGRLSRRWPPSPGFECRRPGLHGIVSEHDMGLSALIDGE